VEVSWKHRSFWYGINEGGREKSFSHNPDGMTRETKKGGDKASNLSYRKPRRVSKVIEGSLSS